ncbi:MAG: hypothetical protein ACLRQF_14525 [Thomasclavelia ramosa]
MGIADVSEGTWIYYLIPSSETGKIMKMALDIKMIKEILLS